MPRFIITGSYTAEAMKGMVASPADRAAAAGALVTAMGGTQEAYYATTGANDFLMIVTADDVADVISALMVAGSSGAVANLETQRAFTTEEFTAMQEKAAGFMASYTPPG